MEKIEIKKSIERTKAIIIFTIIFLFLLMPSFIIKFSDKKEIILLSLTSMIILVLYRRVRRLNYKLNSLTK